MKKTLTLFTFMLLLGKMASAQQEPMFTKYMFNSLVYNPGYAGSKDYLSVGLLHRSQWLGEIEGAPTTQSLTAHTPLRNQRVGVGISVVNDLIGPTRTTGANLSYSYRIPMGKYKFCVGLQGGVDNYNANYKDVVIDDPDDYVFMENVNFVLPNFGMGLFFYGKSFYAGVSSPKLIEYAYGNENPGGPEIYGRAVRHFYLMAGTAIPVKGDAVIFKPSFIWRNVGADKRLSKLTPFKDIGAPNEFQVDLSLLFHQSLWVGASFNSAFSAPKLENPPRSSVGTSDFWVSYVLKNGLRIGAAYSYNLTKLNRVTSGSMEFMLGYEFDFRENKVITPRYF